jgi:hypothetical protein
MNTMHDALDAEAWPSLQAYQQGGAFLFDGRELVWSHYDPATGAHAEPEEILAAAGL